ncbi:MAG: SDR family oxidoreductase [Intrasporangium sp.]|uniref:SDR family oxidoreductase n=1 Tax=Intrasporangium sp. TaxID=1925024 RepID=UPI002648EB96|nr:SDR family oxidoreductase [Intrasporangium sp.]MDN5794543.1 SDR family oxidoreductase [Intrasporangium sp.]
MGERVVVIIGVGPGVGMSVARRFGSEGFRVGLVARSREHLEQLGATLGDNGIITGWAPADIADATALAAAVRRLGEHHGRIDVLHYNPSVFRQKDPLHLGVDELLDDVRVGVGGLLAAVQAARPFMSSGARVLATGSVAADEPWNEACSLGVQKAGLRNLVRSLDATLAPDGIRAMSLTVRGTLGASPALAPDRVAEALFAAAMTADESWRAQLSYPA